MKRIVAAVVALSTVAACAQAPAPDAAGDAQSVCYRNYTVEGTAGVTAVSYRTWREFPNLDQQRALDNLRSAILAEGFSNVGVDASAGALTAVQETSGSGRPQTLRVSARKVGAGTRVDAVFMVQPGQRADPSLVRRNMCRVVDAANL